MRNPQSPLLSRGGDVLQQPWPTPDPLYLETPDTLELVVRVRLSNAHYHLVLKGKGHP